MPFNTRVHPFAKQLVGFRIYFLALFAGSLSQAAIIPVPQDHATIQAAITGASSGDTVLVAPGTYNEQINFLGKAITLVSEQGPATTILDVNYRGLIVSFTRGEGTNSILRGFTLRRAVASFGAAIEIQGASPTIEGNIFEDNVQAAGGFGAGIGANGSSAIVRNNLFRRNTADSQHLSGVVAFVNFSSPLIANNLFIDNDCRALNLTLPQGNQPCVINNTILRNTVGIHVDARVPTAAQIYANNIIVDNDVGLEVVFSFSNPGNDPTWSHNLVFGNAVDYDGITNQTGLHGNISTGPGFACPIEGIFALAPGSACIDAGLTTTPRLPVMDLQGKPRILDGNADGNPVVDIGALEFDAFAGVPSCLYIICPTNLTVSAPPGKTSVAVNYTLPDATPGATLTCSPPSGSIFPAGVTQVRCRVTRGTESETCSFSVYVRVTPSNDDFDNAVALSKSSTKILDTFLATPAPDDPLCPGGGATVWYAFAPPEDTEVSLDTSGSDYYASWSLFTGERGNLLPLVCDAGSFGRFRALAGEVYYVMISSRGTSGGSLLLRFQATPLHRISVGVYSNPLIDPRTGRITLRGTVASSRLAGIALRGRITQRVGRSAVYGDFDAMIFASGTKWTASVTPGNGRFHGGAATIHLFASGFDTETLEHVEFHSTATVYLRHSNNRAQYPARLLVGQPMIGNIK